VDNMANNKANEFLFNIVSWHFLNRDNCHESRKCNPNIYALDCEN